MSAPTDLDTAFRRFELLYDTGRHGEALDVVRTALAQFPQDADLLVEAARAQSILGDLPAARLSADRAMAADPSNARAALVASLVARAQGRVDEAVELGLRAVELAPEHAPGHAQLAVGYAIRRGPGDLDTGRRAAGRALELGPEDVGVLSAVAGFMVAVGDDGHALGVIDRGLALAPQHPGLLTQRAELVEDHGEALTALTGVLADDPQNLDARTQVHGRSWHLLSAGARTAVGLTVYGLLVGTWLWADNRIVASGFLTVLLTALGVFAVIRALRGIGAARAACRQALRGGGIPARIGIALSPVAVLLWMGFAAGSLTLTRAGAVPFLLGLAAAALVVGSAAVVVLLFGEMRAADRAGLLRPGQHSLDVFAHIASAGMRKTCVLSLVVVAASGILFGGIVQGGALGVAWCGVAAGWLVPGTIRSWIVAARRGGQPADRRARARNLTAAAVVAVLGLVLLVAAPRVLDADGKFDTGDRPAGRPAPSVQPFDPKRLDQFRAPVPSDLPTFDLPPMPDISQLDQLTEPPAG